MSEINNRTRYVGLDVHKHLVVACIINQQGKVLSRHCLACSRESLEDFAIKHLCDEDKIVLETTANTWQIVDILKPLVAEVLVSNPLKTRVIAESKCKPDKVDAAGPCSTSSM